MTKEKTSTEGGGERHVEDIKRRFIALNQARLDRARAVLKDRQTVFLDVLPLLFHVNHPMLPGFTSKYTPHGVWRYEPDNKALNRATSLARSFKYKRSVSKNPPVTALYLMGSSGTIAHAEGSDFDIWLCHDPALGPEQCDELQQKAHNIEKWAESLGLEVHFFLINPETFRQGEQTALSSESSGSAQHSLLLDEFYRTSIHLVGQYPLWWLVPPNQEDEYEACVEEIGRMRYLYARDSIDFGGLSHIPAEEFFGAALWQLSKGIDSPYKSILKLLLVETYAREYPDVELLSKQFKQQVYDGVTDPALLDPYTMMMEKVGGYLKRNEEPQRLELAHRCLYFKLDLPLSVAAVADQQARWRRVQVENMVEEWGWSRADLMLMDAHSQWRVHRVLEERQILFRALVTSYRFLSDFARKYSGLSLISQEDLNTLGRKLYTAFERKAGKVEIITHGIDADLGERQVTIAEFRSSEGETSWQVYSGVLGEAQLKGETPIKRARSLTELLAWCHLNGIAGQNTTFKVYSGYSKHSSREIEALFSRIASRFPNSLLHSDDVEEYARPARLVMCEFYTNTGVSVPSNMQMTKQLAASGHTDPFSFGHSGMSQVMSIEQLSVSSWHEAVALRFTGPNAVADAICGYLKWYPPSAQAKPPLPGLFSGTLGQGSSAAKRVEGLLREIIEHFYGDDSGRAGRYIVSIGASHYCFYFEGEHPRYVVLKDQAALVNLLGKPQEEFLPLRFDKLSLKDSFFPLIYQHNKPGIVQCFFHPQGKRVEVFILDEKGSLFHQRLPFHDEHTLLNQFSRFFEAASNRINFLLQEGEMQGHIKGLEFARLSRDTMGRRDVQSVAPEFFQPNKRYFSLQVIVERGEQGNSSFTLYCDDKEFSTLEHGKELFNTVAKHILKLRQGGQPYPIYTTDISLDRSVVGEANVGKLQTLHFLNYKRRIEAQLNRTISGA